MDKEPRKGVMMDSVGVRTMPLLMAAPGEEVRLVAVRGGLGVRRRLADMGLNPGEKIRVIQSGPSGPFLIVVRDSRLALGRGIVHKIEVELV